MGNHFIHHTYHAFRELQVFWQEFLSDDFAFYYRIYKTTSLHPYRTRANKLRIMEQIEQNQASLRKDMDTMGDRMNQLMETLHAVIQGQEELRISVTKLVDVASTSENGGPKKDREGIPKENP